MSAKIDKPESIGNIGNVLNSVVGSLGLGGDGDRDPVNVGDGDGNAVVLGNGDDDDPILRGDPNLNESFQF